MDNHAVRKQATLAREKKKEKRRSKKLQRSKYQGERGVTTRKKPEAHINIARLGVRINRNTKKRKEGEGKARPKEQRRGVDWIPRGGVFKQ